MSDCFTSTKRKARKIYKCIYCGGMILKEEIHLHGTGKWEGDWQNWRMHLDCSELHFEESKSDGGLIYPYEGTRPIKKMASYQLEDGEKGK